jgi:hypothetical protein
LRRHPEIRACRPVLHVACEKISSAKTVKKCAIHGIDARSTAHVETSREIIAVSVMKNLGMKRREEWVW